MNADRADDAPPCRVLVLGGTGTIGRAVVRALVARGHEVVCLVRPGVGRADAPPGVQFRPCDVTDPASLAREGFAGESFDVLLSCLASRTGTPEDAWRIDHDAHAAALDQARAAGVAHMIALSAICVQKPKLEFQRAKLAFERKLIESGIAYTIVRPTAFFKSLSGQVERVRQGKAFMVFGDGMLTACKPIGDNDLAEFLADCIDDPDRRGRILPIGGPGEAITPLMQAEQLFAMLGQEPRIQHVPVALLDAIIATLATLSRIVPSLRAKAELARIGRYYATESMLVWDPVAERYDAASTPATGTQTLFDYYERLLSGEEQAERGDHAVF